MADNVKVVQLFIKFINDKNLNEMIKLITDNHIFIDSLGNIIKSKVKVKKAWKQYFEFIPDYHIDIEKILSDNNCVAIFGKASGSIITNKSNSENSSLQIKKKWLILAAWKAIIENEKISLWQVYADNEPIRNLIR